MLEEGATYMQAAAGYSHTVLSRSDEIPVACGHNSVVDCNVLALEEDVTYMQAATGFPTQCLFAAMG